MPVSTKLQTARPEAGTKPDPPGRCGPSITQANQGPVPRTGMASPTAQRAAAKEVTGSATQLVLMLSSGRLSMVLSISP